MITEPTKRLVNHNQYYDKQAPFKFNIQNKNLRTIQNQTLNWMWKLAVMYCLKCLFIDRR